MLQPTESHRPGRDFPFSVVRVWFQFWASAFKAVVCGSPSGEVALLLGVVTSVMPQSEILAIEGDLPLPLPCWTSEQHLLLQVPSLCLNLQYFIHLSLCEIVPGKFQYLTPLGGAVGRNHVLLGAPSHVSLVPVAYGGLLC